MHPAQDASCKGMHPVRGCMRIHLAQGCTLHGMHPARGCVGLHPAWGCTLQGDGSCKGMHGDAPCTGVHREHAWRYTLHRCMHPAWGCTGARTEMHRACGCTLTVGVTCMGSTHRDTPCTGMHSARECMGSAYRDALHGDASCMRMCMEYAKGCALSRKRAQGVCTDTPCTGMHRERTLGCAVPDAEPSTCSC